MNKNRQLFYWVVLKILLENIKI